MNQTTPETAQQDDPTIGDADRLLRRIFPGWYVPDQKTSGMRLSSAAFDDQSDGSPMSVHLGSVLVDLGLSDDSVLQGHAGYGLAEVSARLVRDNSQVIKRKPERLWPAHAEVIGRKTDAIRRRLAKAANLLIPPRGPGLV